MDKKPKDIKKIVQDGYAEIAKKGTSCCSSGSCCGSSNAAEEISKSIGYSDDDMKSVPDGANLGLGCGNPVALASLREGEIVLDLGSGAGFDAFLAAARVGMNGKVIGVDMTQEMVKKAQGNAQKNGYTNVEFRLGEIEKLPVEDNSIDVIISNCVINLSPDKQAVFAEAFRVLKLGGRLMVSDLVLVKNLPDTIKQSIEAYVGCLAGASLKDDYIGFIQKAGFSNITIVSQTHYPIAAIKLSDGDIADIEQSAVSIKISAIKPT